ncbi:MAG: hypothetical protein MUO78_10830 [candidate division Zixibacteria bacterium]|nr:hypothetical protein [candidate division Zixibacteria bacterium]
MELLEDKIVYRYFGIELRIVFYLTSFIFLLLSIFNFKSSSLFSLFSFLIFILSALLTYLDYTRHLLILGREGMSFSQFLTRKSENHHLYWTNVQQITTREYGIFKIFKVTRIISKVKEIKVFSFMEDYPHFLKEICEKSKNAEIDKLTRDLLGGQADF